MSDGAVHTNRNTNPDPSGETVESFDLNQIRSIVREVIRRLQQQDSPESVEHEVVLDRVVTAQEIEKLSKNTRATLRSDAIVTAAASDLARDRGIELQRGASKGSQRNRQTRDHEIGEKLTDTDNPERGQVVADQLRRRQVTLNTRIVLSDTPAATVVREIKQGEVAVMITTLDQIDRFAAECDPSTWVLDMKRLNLTAAVNVVARISKLSTVTS